MLAHFIAVSARLPAFVSTVCGDEQALAIISAISVAPTRKAIPRLPATSVTAMTLLRSREIKGRVGTARRGRVCPHFHRVMRISFQAAYVRDRVSSREILRLAPGSMNIVFRRALNRTP